MELSQKALTLLESYKNVENSGHRLGYIKKDLLPFAEELVNAGKLVKLPEGFYKLTPPAE